MRIWTQQKQGRIPQSKPVLSPGQLRRPSGSHEGQSSPVSQPSSGHPETRGHELSRIPNSNRSEAIDATQDRHEEEANRIGGGGARRSSAPRAGAGPPRHPLPPP